ncbi:hypothetical protein, partial [Streptomyces sp. NPDC058401]|uniref:hypothetical protein n=1 Tax=Streptomyces sp. NPDC058401 TaxID=3346480 RepID=UPI0036524FAB
RNLIHRNGRGINFLALIFGTLLSSQGTDASFVPVSRPSGRFLRFQLYQIISAPFPALDLNSVTVGGSVPFGAPPH